MDATENAADAEAEVRHRLANAFQLLSTLTRMRQQRAQDPETRRQLGWLLDAMGALGVLQQRLSEGGVDMAGYLEEMLPVWRRRCEGRPIQVVLEAEPAQVSGHEASALALIVNELVANALAHAFADGEAGQVRIVLRRLADGQAELSVADEGCGFDPAVAGTPGKLGLWLVKGLAAQMKAGLSTTREGGVATRLTFAVGA